MIILKKLLKENPDVINSGGIHLDWDSEEANITFGNDGTKMMICPSPHPETYRFYDFIKYCNTNPDYSLELAAEEFDDDISPSYDFDAEIISRFNFRYPGRAWLKNKILSFWVYPKENEIKKILSDIEKEYKRVYKYIKEYPIVLTSYYTKNKTWPTSLNFNDNDWKIEIVFNKQGKMKYDVLVNYDDEDKYEGSQYVKKLISLSKYVGSEERSKEDLATQHVLSPLLKKKREVMKGWGSKHDKTKTLNPYTNPKLKYGNTRAYWGDSYVPSLKKLLSEDNTKKKKLYFTIGISGCGKSTYLNKHFSKDIIVSPDDIRKQMTGNISNQDMNIAVWEDARSQLRTLLDTKGIAVLDGTNTSSYYRNLNLKEFNDLDIEKIALVFPANVKVSYDRIQQQLKKGIDRANVPYSVVQRQYEELTQGYSDLKFQFDKIKKVK